MTSDEYKKTFGFSDAAKPDREKALNLALEVRKFEIGLYWKRAAYFWAFIAIALAAYVSVLAAKDFPTSEKGQALLAISCFGSVFSVAWYFVNRASKFWQENWEKHVDMLEDGVVGPLYKTVLSDEDVSFWRLWGPYPFSVSKLNQILSLFVVALFFLLVAATLRHYFHWPPDLFTAVTLLLSFGALLTLWWRGRTRPRGEVSRVRAEKRSTEIV